MYANLKVVDLMLDAQYPNVNAPSLNDLIKTNRRPPNDKKIK